MSDKITLAAELREDQGKGASRRLRRLEGKVPAIVYGEGEPQAVSLLHKELWKAQESEAFYSSILELDVAGKTEAVIVKDLQRHPAKDIILHADFQRIDLTKEIQVYVPLHFTNEESCKGVKIGGGNIAHLKTSVEVSCLPTALPEYIEVDMLELDTGDILHISDLTLPEGVSSVALAHEHDLAIAQVNAPKRGAATAEAEGETEGDAEGEAS